MAKTMAARAAQANRLRQVYTLLALGVVFLLAALILRPDPYGFPAGVLLFGVGMLIAMLLYPLRLGVGGCLTTALGAAVFLTFKHIIPGNLVLALYILAIGIGLLGIALLARRGYIGKGALSPAIIVLLVGIVEVLLSLNLTPPNFVSFMLSLWLPGIGLLVVGIAYFFSNGRS
jgi:hypothetical protein